MQAYLERISGAPFDSFKKQEVGVVRVTESDCQLSKLTLPLNVVYSGVDMVAKKKVNIKLTFFGSASWQPNKYG